MTASALAAGPAEEDMDTTGLAAPDHGGDPGEDEDEAAAAEAAEAAQCRESARLARDLAARVLAEAQAEAEAEAVRILTEAKQEAERLAGEAEENDADAAWHEMQARLLPQAAAARREIAGIREHAAALAGQVPVIEAEQADAQERLAALAGRRAGQEQWRRVARQSADVDAIKAATAEESAIGEAEAAQQARAAAAARALASLAAAAQDAARREQEAAARLADLERQLGGFLPVAELHALADKILCGALMLQGTRGREAADAALSWLSPMERIALYAPAGLADRGAYLAQLLDRLCEQDPDAFDDLAARARDGRLFAVPAGRR